MWVGYFQVGDANGTDLQLAECGTSVDPERKAASMLLHITPEASGHFENV